MKLQTVLAIFIITLNGFIIQKVQAQQTLVNLSLRQPSEQSSTAWDFSADLAVDGDLNTCAMTPRSSDSRWWQVDLGGSSLIKRVTVFLSSEEEVSTLKLTIFVIDYDDRGRSNFLKCNHFIGTNSSTSKTRIDLNCSPGQIRGSKVFIRDDRKDVADLKLCEVEVAGVALSSDKCPPLSLKNGQTVVKDGPGPSTVQFSCHRGFVLWGISRGVCVRGKWTFQTSPECKPISCGHPQEFSYSKITKSKSLDPKSYSSSVGDVVRYGCEEGYKLYLNSSNGHPSPDFIEAECSIEGFWLLPHDFACINETLYYELYSTYQSSSSFGTEMIIYLVLLVLLLVLLIFLCCLLYKSHRNRKNRLRKRSQVLRPRISESLIGSRNSDTTQFLFPNFKTIDLKDSVKMYGDENEVDHVVMRKTDSERAKSIMEEDNDVGAADGEPLYQNQPPLDMGTFKSTSTLRSWSQSESTNNWTLRAKPSYQPPPLAPPPPPPPPPPEFQTDEWDDEFDDGFNGHCRSCGHFIGNSKCKHCPDQFVLHHYSNIDEKNKLNQRVFNSSEEALIPEIDEAGYASLIVIPTKANSVLLSKGLKVRSPRNSEEMLWAQQQDQLLSDLGRKLANQGPPSEVSRIRLAALGDRETPDGSSAIHDLNMTTTATQCDSLNSNPLNQDDLMSCEATEGFSIINPDAMNRQMSIGYYRNETFVQSIPESLPSHVEGFSENLYANEEMIHQMDVKRQSKEAEKSSSPEVYAKIDKSKKISSRESLPVNIDTLGVDLKVSYC